jgi:hypothetical protein
MNNNQNPMNFLMNLMSMGNNPQQIINNVLNQNPQMQVAINQMKTSGMSTKDYVLQYARQNNINIQPFIQMMNSRGININ